MRLVAHPIHVDGSLRRRRLLQLTGGAVATGLAGCSGGTGGADADTDIATPTGTPPTPAEAMTDTGAAMETDPSPPSALAVQDQRTHGTSVTVPRAAIDGTGWLVIHPEAEGGGPDGGVVLAKRLIEPGTYTDVELSLDNPITADRTLYAMLHYDDPADGEFTFPAGGDPPVVVDGSPVIEPFAVTVTGGVTATVTIQGTRFHPERLSVAPGTTVEWVNEDGYGHDVTAASFHGVAADWSFEDHLPGDGRTSHTFEEPGVYEYYCSIHGRSVMCGVVLVGDATLDEELPCEGGGGGY